MPPRRRFERLALLLFALFLAVAVGEATVGSRRFLLTAARVAGESPAAERRRHFGADYVEAVETIRHAVPRDGAYLLFHGPGDSDAGALRVRFDLLPRRCALVGRRALLGAANRRLRRAIEETRWVVVAYPLPRPPRLVDRHELARQLRAGALD